MHGRTLLAPSSVLVASLLSRVILSQLPLGSSAPIAAWCWSVPCVCGVQFVGSYELFDWHSAVCTEAVTHHRRVTIDWCIRFKAVAERALVHCRRCIHLASTIMVIRAPTTPCLAVVAVWSADLYNHQAALK